MSVFDVHPFATPANATALREEVRAFLAANLPAGGKDRHTNCWAVGNPEFSRKLGAADFIGMLWPRKYGGHERDATERYIVLEELLAAGAPVGSHWISDRQTGPLLLKYGTEAQRNKYLPGMARGELFACIGLSEPGSGSDLASIRTSATRTDKGWRLDGQKVWTTNAHDASVILALVRTEAGSKRQQGLSQFLVDLDLPGVEVRPIIDLVGHHEFNEVFFDGVEVPDGALIGEEGNGWAQATAELALERSGPERYLSSHVLLAALIDIAGPDPDPVVAATIGRLTAEMWTLRQMSMSVAAKLAAGKDPTVEAAVVKDLGNSYEQSLPVVIQAALGDEATLADGSELADMLAMLLQTSPSFSLRGGTREIMRAIIAKGLGLR